VVSAFQNLTNGGQAGAAEPLAAAPRAAMAATVVVKLGGRALEDPGALGAFADDVARLGHPVVVVHGGGAEVSAWSARLGVEPRFAAGLRVTDPRTLEIAAAVLAGLANKRLVAGLRARGVNAVGLAALDGGLARVAPHAQAAQLGEVGEVRAIDGEWLSRLVAEGRVPVLASIGADGERLLNLNADDLAAAVAAALGATLLLLSDVEGVRLGRRLAARLESRAVDAVLRSPDVTGGMTPKLAAAARAVEGGAPAAWIASWSGPGTLGALLEGRAIGTLIAHSSPGLAEAHHA
jgi:acetylglutamate kinase